LMLRGSVGFTLGRYVLGSMGSTLFLSTPLYCSLLTLRGISHLSGWLLGLRFHHPSQFTLGSV